MVGRRFYHRCVKILAMFFPTEHLLEKHSLLTEPQIALLWISIHCENLVEPKSTKLRSPVRLPPPTLTFMLYSSSTNFSKVLFKSSYQLRLKPLLLYISTSVLATTLGFICLFRCKGMEVYPVTSGVGWA
jgi:hypothetical protein